MASMPTPQKILVRAPNWIGDQILAYPFFHHLRAGYPGAQITAVCQPWVASVQFRHLVVGHLAGHKGHRYLLEAASRLLRAEPGTGVALVGEGALRRELEARAAALGGAERVRFTGFRRDVAALVRGFEIFAFSSTHEGTPNAVLEAMALGKPVVATRAGGTDEVVQDGVTGLLVPPRDPAALADALLYLLRHPEQGRTFGRAGRRRVEELFTVERMAGSTLEAYRRILADAAA